MATAPRNLRTKQPRSLRPRQLHASPGGAQAYRYGAAITPTPPPVAVNVAPRAPVSTPAAEPAGTAHKRGGMAVWWWFAMSALVCAATAAVWRRAEPGRWLAQQMEPLKIDERFPSTAALLQPVDAVASAAPNAGWQVQHDGPVPLEWGALVLPDSFRSSPGNHDLIIHFHGDMELVRQSVGYAKLDAALAVINLGEGAKPYGGAFQRAGAFERLLVQIEQAMERRGVKEPQLRRLALTSWGAGYAAIASILEHRQAPHANADPLDAIITLDGLHCAFIDGDRRRLNERSMLPWLRVAEAAADDQLFFGITHSRMQSPGYASSERTAAMLLDRVGVERSSGPTLRIPAAVRLPAATLLYKQVPRLLPLHDTRVGGLRIQGFDGDSREHHAAHLTQMAAIGLSDLAARWSSEAKPTAAPAASEAPASDQLAPKPDEAPAAPDEAEPADADAVDAPADDHPAG